MSSSTKESIHMITCRLFCSNSVMCQEAERLRLSLWVHLNIKAMPSKTLLSSEVELKLYRKVPARTRSLPQTSLLCALCGGDVYVFSCVRTGNGFPRAWKKSGVIGLEREQGERGGGQEK